MNNKYSGNEIKKTYLQKYLGINPTKEVKYLDNEKVKIHKKEIDVPGRWRDSFILKDQQN